jgi:TetR/AcrR family transcriptional regulator, transcriptional repressor for nem operon
MKHFSEHSPMAERIVDAAEALLQQHGYNGFSYDDIAKIVGIKKPSVHHHFATKAELVAVTVQRYTHRFSEQLLNIEGSDAAGVDRLLSYAALFENTYAINKRICVCGMLGAEMQALPDVVAVEVAEFFTANLTWLEAEIAHATALQQIRNAAEADVSVQKLAQNYLCALEGAMVVGRGSTAIQGPAAVGQTFMSMLAPIKLPMRAKK